MHTTPRFLVYCAMVAIKVKGSIHVPNESRLIASKSPRQKVTESAIKNMSNRPFSDSFASSIRWLRFTPEFGTLSGCLQAAI